MLLPLEHEYRIKSPADAEAFLRALQFCGGRASVGVRGHHTKDPRRILRLVSAIEPKRDHQISFGAGKMNLDAMAQLATKRFHYFDLATRAATYRSWPDMPRTWVHANTSDAETSTFEDIPAAIEKFRTMAGDELRQGFINGVQEESKAALVEFLVATEAEVHAYLHIEFASARGLAELYEGEKFDWANMQVTVDFPEGRIHGFLTSPNVQDEHKARWQKRITRALRKAKVL